MVGKRPKIQAHLPSEWLEEIDLLIVEKFPGKTRSDWFRDVVGLELAKQKNGHSKDARLDQLLKNDEKMLTLLQQIHDAVAE